MARHVPERCDNLQDGVGRVSAVHDGRGALVVTSPPYGPSVHGQVKAEQRRGAEGGVRKYDNRYGQDPANLAHQGLDELLAGFTAILSGCAVLLRPGGRLIARPSFFQLDNLTSGRLRRAADR
jgi:hypothetical protein